MAAYEDVRSHLKILLRIFSTNGTAITAVRWVHFVWLYCEDWRHSIKEFGIYPHPPQQNGSRKNGLVDSIITIARILSAWPLLALKTLKFSCGKKRPPIDEESALFSAASRDLMAFALLSSRFYEGGLIDRLRKLWKYVCSKPIE